MVAAELFEQFGEAVEATGLAVFFEEAGEFIKDSWSTPEAFVNTVYLWPAYTTMGQMVDRSATNYAESASSNSTNGMNNTDTKRSPLNAIRGVVRSEISNANSADVRVVAEKEKIVLICTVPSEYLKYLIEERATEAASGWGIDNRLRVAQSR